MHSILVGEGFHALPFYALIKCEMRSSKFEMRNVGANPDGVCSYYILRPFHFGDGPVLKAGKPYDTGDHAGSPLRGRHRMAFYWVNAVTILGKSIEWDAFTKITSPSFKIVSAF